MRPSERRDVRQELRGSAESVALALHDSMAEVKRVPANDGGGKEVQAGYAEMLVLQCHLALSRNRPDSRFSLPKGHRGSHRRATIRPQDRHLTDIGKCLNHFQSLKSKMGGSLSQ